MVGRIVDSALESAMSTGFRRRNRLFGVLAWVLLAAAVSAPARADTLDIHVDEARLLKLPGHVTTIVIGNPLIADATLQSGGILVVTGKGYGATNLMALDRSGKVIMRKDLRVFGPIEEDLVVVYKGIDRETYSCAPNCHPRITLGDSTTYFNETLNQASARNGQAQGNAAPAAK
jgi:Pilus formation protein N terminal region